MWSYYTRVHGNQIDVSLEMFDANNVLTTSTSDRVKNVYTVTLRKLRGSTPTTVSA